MRNFSRPTSRKRFESFSVVPKPVDSRSFRPAWLTPVGMHRAIIGRGGDLERPVRSLRGIELISVKEKFLRDTARFQKPLRIFATSRGPRVREYTSLGEPAQVLLTVRKSEEYRSRRLKMKTHSFEEQAIRRWKVFVESFDLSPASGRKISIVLGVALANGNAFPFDPSREERPSWRQSGR